MWGLVHEAGVGEQTLLMTLPLCSAGAATWGESGAGGELCEVGVGGWAKEVELGAPGEA